jgi:carboxyl-terminal processing protease
VRPNSSFGYGVAAGLVLGLLVAAALGLAGDVLFGSEQDAPTEAREVIEANYFEEVPAEQLDGASIRGMVAELRERYDDRFSHYFSPRQLDAFERATSGEFDGIGLAVNEVREGLRVAAVYPDAPAEAAGLEEGDVITAVDGKSIAGVSAEVSTGRIKGPPGTEVELRVEPLRGKPRNVTVERASVRIPAVSGEIRRVDGRGIGYVRYETFSRGAHGELRDEVDRLLRDGAEGIALDLRGNGGGLLNEAILSASIFVEDGVVVSTESRTEPDIEYEAVGDAIDPRPMVVITNRDTASASEILAAALQTYDLAQVVGTRTFGKGTFQEVIGLEAGGALDLTIGEYLTADGTSIAGEGVQPDVAAPDDPRTERDEALDRALAVLGREL